MNTRLVKPGLVAATVLALLGALGAEAYHVHTQANEKPLAEHAPAAENPAPGLDSQDPWSVMHAEMMRMQAQMDAMFDSTFRDLHDSAHLGQAPTDTKVTLEVENDSYIVKVSIPGASESDINVNLDGRLLSISSESQDVEKLTNDNGQVTRQKSYASSFQQAFTLPGPVNAAGMKTEFHDGTLTISIPKAASSSG